MSPFSRGSWTSGLVGFALAVLAVCAALQWAAGLLLQALPVLLPVAGFIILGLLAWRIYSSGAGRW